MNFSEWHASRLVRTMLQVSFIILFWISLKILHCAQFYSFYAYDLIIIFSIYSKLLNTLSYYSLMFSSVLTLHNNAISVSWSLTSSKSLSLHLAQYQRWEWAYFAIFLAYFSFWHIFILTYYAQSFAWSFNILLTVTSYLLIFLNCTQHGQLYLDWSWASYITVCCYQK